MHDGIMSMNCTFLCNNTFSFHFAASRETNSLVELNRFLYIIFRPLKRIGIGICVYSRAGIVNLFMRINAFQTSKLSMFINYYSKQHRTYTQTIDFENMANGRKVH